MFLPSRHVLQGNYAAANAATDAWAESAGTAGRPCVAVQWGVWAEAGMAAAASGLVARLARQACCALSHVTVGADCCCAQVHDCIPTLQQQPHFQAFLLDSIDHVLHRATAPSGQQWVWQCSAACCKPPVTAAYRGPSSWPAPSCGTSFCRVCGPPHRPGPAEHDCC